MSISNEVSSLESQLESLAAENKVLNNARIINEFEISSLRKLNEKLQAERDAALDSAAQMKVILDQAGAAIVSGMSRFHAAKRVDQEALMTDDPMPLFLEKAANGADPSAH